MFKDDEGIEKDCVGVLRRTSEDVGNGIIIIKLL
jgi:hypothetical protein